MPPAADVASVLRYHERSKHHPHRYAPSPGGLDWANEPDPFRRFAGAPAVELPLGADRLDTPYEALHRPGSVAARPLDRTSVGVFFELALGLSAWKQHGRERWALRCNPSSGNLHPTEGYALLPSVPGVPGGLYHYLSLEHALERRSSLSAGAGRRLARLLPAGGFLAGLTSIHWREAWKYGLRAFRYCAQDTGHAIAALRYAAAALGWSARLVAGLGDEDVAALLGLDGDAYAGVDTADREHPDTLLLVAPSGADMDAGVGRVADAVEAIIGLLRAGSWAGRANPLSPVHVDWPAIGAVTEATGKPRTAEAEPAGRAPQSAAENIPAPRPGSRLVAARLIRQRRSAVEMDGRTSITAENFYTMLERLLPRPSVPPWDALPWSPRVHLGLFLHRVTGLAPGLYAFERGKAVHDGLVAALRPGFRWQRPPECPEHLRLFLLEPGDVRAISRLVSCRQDIAADGAFSLGMLAEFRESLALGPWWYRRLHWEAGVAGQALYLEAEAAGAGATGMGCFFDDAFHGVLGLADERYQDVYHFTVGGPVEDPRLTTLPPYAERDVSPPSRRPERAMVAAPARLGTPGR